MSPEYYTNVLELLERRLKADGFSDEAARVGDIAALMKDRNA